MLFCCTRQNCKNVTVKMSIDLQDVECPKCRGKMGLMIDCSPESKFSHKRSLIEEELAIQSQALKWVDPKNWFGPMALEYMRLKDLMCDGKIEASCWKLMNLMEVSVGLLYCLTINRYRSNNTFGSKINCFRGLRNPDERLIKILEFLDDINKWRNISGVGHGTLVESKEPYVRKLIEVQPLLNKNLGVIDEMIKRKKVKGLEELKGPDYVMKIKSFDTNKKNIEYNPLIVRGYGFDGPELYVFDCYYEEDKNVGYRNYSRNRKKFIFYGNGEISWERNRDQVDWLNAEERTEWINWANGQFPKRDEDFKKNICSILLDAAEGFYLRGFNEDALWAVKKFESLGFDDEYLRARRLLVEFGIKALENDRESADGAFRVFQNASKRLPDPVQKIFIEVEALRQYGCYLGENRKYEKAFENLKEALSKLRCEDINSYYFTRLTLELEIKKDILYYRRYLRPWPEIKDYAEVIFMASQLYESDPFNQRLIDTLAWALNLFGEMVDERVDNGELEESALNEADCCYEFAQKIRNRALDNEPNDIWVGRGYAWNLHVRARALAKRGKIDDARKLFNEALNKREELIQESFQKSYGLQKDVEKNKCDLEFYCNQGKR